MITCDTIYAGSAIFNCPVELHKLAIHFMKVLYRSNINGQWIKLLFQDITADFEATETLVFVDFHHQHCL